VLIGIANMLFVFFSPTRFALIVMLTLSCILWAVRCLFQIAYPQGTINPLMQYGMILAFIAIFLCFSASLLLAVQKTMIGTATRHKRLFDYQKSRIPFGIAAFFR
jgi:hypothetical protein